MNVASKILIIDDDSMVVESIKITLRKELYQILTADNGMDGLKILEKEKPILVILDLRMPIMDGVEFLNNINLSHTDPYSVIVLTGHGEDEDIKKCFGLGVSTFLNKPFNVHVLRGLVRHAIELKESQKKISLLCDNLECQVKEDEKELQIMSGFTSTSPNPIVRCKLDGEILYSNSSMNHLIEEMGWGPVSNIKSMTTHHFEKISNIIGTDKTIIDEEIAINGKTFLVTCNSSSQKNSVFICFIDITERKQLEESLIVASHKAEAATMAKSTFIHNMSHELRTPLNAVIGFSSILQVYNISQLDENQKNQIDNIYNSGQKILQMVNDIIELSNAEVGKMDFELGDGSIPDIISTTVAIVKPSSNKKRITIELDLDKNLPTVTADVPKITRIISNLLDNAVKFTPDGGKIKVEARKIDDNVQISVIDSGIGIKPEEINKIFLAFEQADMSSTRKYGGSGLGLVIATKFVEAHSGKIWVESDGENGSTFKFTIPLKGKPYSEYIAKLIKSLCTYEHFLQHAERFLFAHKRMGRKFAILYLVLRSPCTISDNTLFVEVLENMIRKHEIPGMGKNNNDYYVLLFDVEVDIVNKTMERISNILKKNCFTVDIKSVIYPDNGESVEKMMSTFY